jgi:DNA (cytosine-5)-methyltransferase 1
MLKISVENLTLVQNLGYAHSAPKEIAPKVRPDNQSRIFSAKRKFMFAIPHLRFGSGVRFELSNKFDKDFPIWSFKFIYGNSKSIKTLDLNTDIDISYKDYITKEYWDLFNHEITKLTSKYKNYNSLLIQSIWTHKCKGIHPFTLIDDTGDLINKLVLKRVLSINPKKSINYILEVYNNKKIDDNAYNILIGILVLSRLNKEIIKTQLHENRSHIFTLERV